MLRLRKITHAFRPERPVLRGVSVEFRPGAVTGILGVNGCGKSTLLKIALGVLSPTSGSVEIDGAPVGMLARGVRARRLVYIPQRSGVSFAYTAAEVVAMGRFAAGEGDSEATRESVARALTRVELADRATELVGELSAGQQQRVTLARALAQLDLAMSARGGPSRGGPLDAGPSVVLLADEPVSAMDIRHARDSCSILRETARAGAAVAVVLHDLSLAAEFTDRSVVLDGSGAILADDESARVLESPALGLALGVRFDSAIAPDGRRIPLPMKA